MSEKNSELDRTKYDLDEEYVEGEDYGLNELVKILDPVFHDGEALAESNVYDRIKRTIVPQLEKLFHIDIDEFKKNEDEKVRFYYLQFLKELYSVEYPSNKNVENASDKNVENASDINVENPSDENKVKLQGVLKRLSGEYIKDKNPQNSSTDELDKFADEFIRKIEEKISKKGDFVPYTYSRINKNIIKMKSQWQDRIINIYDLIYNGKKITRGKHFSAKWNLERIKELLDLLYERISKLEGKGWTDKSHNIFITFYIIYLCKENIGNCVTLREYLNEKNNKNRKPGPELPNSSFLSFITSSIFQHQKRNCRSLIGFIKKICKVKKITYSDKEYNLAKIVCFILDEKIEDLPNGIQLTNKQCNGLLFASKLEHIDKILALWESNKTRDCKKYRLPVFISTIQTLYNLRSDKEMRIYSIPGYPKKSLYQMFSKNDKKTFKIVSPYLLEIVEDNLLWNSQQYEISSTLRQIIETLLKIEKITFSIYDFETFLDVNNYVLEAIDLITTPREELDDYRYLIDLPLLTNTKFEHSLLVRRVIRCKLNFADMLMIKNDIDELLNENNKTLPMIRDNEIYTIYITEGKKILLFKETDELFVLVKEGDREVLHGFSRKYDCKTLKSLGIADYADYYDDVMDNYCKSEFTMHDGWTEKI